MARTNADIAAAAYKTIEAHPCYWQKNDAEHADCMVTDYYTAMILTHGSDKAHRIVFRHHSADDKMYTGAGPSCGSKANGKAWVSYGRFAPKVTCGRC